MSAHFPKPQPGPLWVLVNGKWKMTHCPWYLEDVWKHIPDKYKQSP